MMAFDEARPIRFVTNSSQTFCEIMNRKGESPEAPTAVQNCDSSSARSTHLTSISLPSNQPVLDEPGTLYFLFSLAFTGPHYFRNPSIRRIAFEPGFRAREPYGFFDYPSLSRVDIPASIEIIGILAFLNCKSLTEVIFVSDSHIKTIDGFQECESLSRIDNLASIQIIGDVAFFKCKSLPELIFISDSHVKIINGFKECESLSRIGIPMSIEIIGILAFLNCKSLTEVIIIVDSHVRTIDGFQECESLSGIDIPASIEIIGGVAFFKCKSLTELIFISESHIRAISGFQNANHFLRPTFLYSLTSSEMLLFSNANRSLK
jgi:hypothetical protein